MLRVTNDEYILKYMNSEDWYDIASEYTSDGPKRELTHRIICKRKEDVQDQEDHNEE